MPNEFKCVSVSNDVHLANRHTDRTPAAEVRNSRSLEVDFLAIPMESFHELFCRSLSHLTLMVRRIQAAQCSICGTM